MKNIKILLYIEKYINGILKMPLMFLEIYFMKIVKRISCIFLMMLFIFCFEYTVSQAINFVNTDYIHEFKQDINNLLDDNIDTYFTLPDFTNYLEFKLENHSGVSGIELVLMILSLIINIKYIPVTMDIRITKLHLIGNYRLKY